MPETSPVHSYPANVKVKHAQYLPIVAALAESFLPASPDRATAAEHQNLHDLAQLQAYGGSQQSAQVEKVGVRFQQLHLHGPDFCITTESLTC